MRVIDEERLNKVLKCIREHQESGKAPTLHMAVFPGRQGRNNRPVRAVIGGQQAS